MPLCDRTPSKGDALSEGAVSDRRNFVCSIESLLTFAVGALLIAAALLKLVSSTQSDEFGAAVALASFEVILGIWLLSALQRPAAIMVAAGVFAIFAIVSGWRFGTGATRCGCLGEIAMPPLVMPLLDGAVLIALLLTISRTYRVSPSRSAIAVFVPALLAVVSITAGWVSSRSQAALLEAPAYNFGVVHASGALSRSVPITNATARDIEVWTTSASCGCARLQCTEKLIPARGTGQAIVTIDLSGYAHLEGRLRVERLLARHGMHDDAGRPNHDSPAGEAFIGCTALTDKLGARTLVADRMGCYSVGLEYEHNVQAGARSLHPGGVQVLLCDGAVRFVADAIQPETWHAAHTRHGKETLHSDD